MTPEPIRLLLPRDARIAAGYGGTAGLERLAKTVNRSISWLRLVETGRLRPNDLLARRLARALCCSSATFCLPDSAFGRPNLTPRERRRKLREQAERRRARAAAAAASFVTDPGRPARTTGRKSPALPSPRSRGGVATAPTGFPVSPEGGRR